MLVETAAGLVSGRRRPIDGGQVVLRHLVGPPSAERAGTPGVVEPSVWLGRAPWCYVRFDQQALGVDEGRAGYQAGQKAHPA